MEAPETRVLERAELARLLAKARGSSIEALVFLIAGTGLRIGEALGLRWRDVNARASTARIAQAQVEDAGKILMRGPKTSNSERTVSLPSAVVGALERHRAALPATPHGERLIFENEKGGPMRRSNLIRRHWHPLLDAAEIQRGGFHLLRHTYASHALGAGVDARTVADQIGHRDASVTWNVYAKTVATGRERLAAAWEEILATPATPAS